MEKMFKIVPIVAHHHKNNADFSRHYIMKTEKTDPPPRMLTSQKTPPRYLMKIILDTEKDGVREMLKPP